MADGRAIHGKNALIYLSDTQLVGANAWTLDITAPNVEVDEFGFSWVRNLKGINAFGGSITAWQHQDDKLLKDCATADGPVALILYPDRDDQTNNYTGDVVVTAYNGSGATQSAVGGNITFVGDDALTVTGFA